MKNYTQQELNEVLELHKEWLADNREGVRADLSCLNLSSADLSFTDLSCLNLSSADLSFIDLSDANLKGSKLRGANLKGSNLRCANLEDSNLVNANLAGADLKGTNLSYADLRGTNLKGAYLSGADLRGTNLAGAYLAGANLTGASTQSVFGLDIYSVDNIGTFRGKATFSPALNTVWAGCWTGTLDEFLEKGLQMNRDTKDANKIKAAYAFFKACE